MLATSNYTNGTPCLAKGSHLHSQEKRKQRDIRAFLECVTINQIRLIDKSMGVTSRSFPECYVNANIMNFKNFLCCTLVGT
jgi:hypothetical protein